MNASDRLRDRLVEGGWVLKRTGKHEVWHHPRGGRFTLGRNVQDSSRAFKNYLAQIEREERATQPAPIPPVEPPSPEPPVVKQIKVTLPWNKWVMDTRMATKLSRKDVAEVLGLRSGDVVANIEQGVRLFSPGEFNLWLNLFDHPTPPQGLVIPFATVADIAKRQGRSKQLAQNPPLPPPAETVEDTAPEPPVETPTLPPPPPEEEPMAAQIDTRAQALQEARALLTSPRLTDAEVAQLVQGLKAQAKALIIQSLEAL